MIKKKPSRKLKLVDWDSVHNLYRLGTMSLQAIAEQYNADHVNSEAWKKTVTKAGVQKEAGLKKWRKNLADKVQERVKENLVYEGVDIVYQKNDETIVEHAAENTTKVIVRHRDEIKALLEHEERLLKELETGSGKVHVSNYQGVITLTNLDLTVKEKSATLKDLAAVRAQRIALERQAHNINDNDTSGEVKAIRVSAMEID